MRETQSSPIELQAIISAADASKRLLSMAAMRIGSFGSSMARRNTDQMISVTA
jgi:hypothetical protein